MSLSTLFLIPKKRKEKKVSACVTWSLCLQCLISSSTRSVKMKLPAYGITLPFPWSLSSSRFSCYDFLSVIVGRTRSYFSSETSSVDHACVIHFTYSFQFSLVSTLLILIWIFIFFYSNNFNLVFPLLGLVLFFTHLILIYWF